MKKVEPGIYLAHPIAEAPVIYTNEKGNTLMRIEFRIDDLGITQKHWFVLVNKNDEINERSYKALRELFGWDGTDFEYFTQNTFEDFEVKLVIDDDDENPKYSRIRFVNPVDKKPPSVDIKALQARLGGKLRAMSGVVPAAPTSGAKAVPTRQQKTTSAPKVKPVEWPQAREEEINAVYATLFEDMAPTKGEKAAEDKWFEICAEVIGADRDFNTMNTEELKAVNQRVMAIVDIPF